MSLLWKIDSTNYAVSVYHFGELQAADHGVLWTSGPDLSVRLSDRFD